MIKKLCSSSEILKEIKNTKYDYITIGKILETFGEGGFSIILLIFAAPLALPLPALGVAQVMAVPIFLLAFQLMIGRKYPWIPVKWANKEVSVKKMSDIIDKIIPTLHKVESFLKPRIKFLSSKLGHQIIGLSCLMCSISILLPFPFSNTVPSMGILIMSVGLLERDGVAVITGMFVGFLGICLAAAVIYFGVEVVSSIKNMLMQWF